MIIGGGRRSKGALNEAMWSGMEGLKSSSTPGRERGHRAAAWKGGEEGRVG